MKATLSTEIDLKHEISAPSSVSRAHAAIVAGLLGLVLIWSAALSPLPHLHNAAHDARHSFAVPCH